LQKELNQVLVLQKLKSNNNKKVYTTNKKNRKATIAIFFIP
jgi:hypothetical protein